MNTGVKRFKRVFPLYRGLTADLLFYNAIDTLFLALIKGFTAAQLASLTSLSSLCCLALRFPILFVVKKIGNSASVRTGAFLMVCSAVSITFGQSYFVVLLGRVLHDVSGMFRSASLVALRNNLALVGEQKEYVRLRTAANTVYSVITMLISFVASYLFNVNPYLPMASCIAVCLFGFVISWFAKDCTPDNRIVRTRGEKRASKLKVSYGKFIVFAIAIYAGYYAIVGNGQSEGKLFIQQQTLLTFDAEKTALIIGAVVTGSRIVRVLSNLVFAKLYAKHQSKMGIFLPALLASAMAFLLFGSFIPTFAVKIVVMALGFMIILFVRDPFRIYIEDVLLDRLPKEQHQTLLTVMGFCTSLVSGGTGLVFSAILVKSPLIVVIGLMLGVALVLFLMSIFFYRAVMTERAGREEKTAKEG